MTGDQTALTAKLKTAVADLSQSLKTGSVDLESATQKLKDQKAATEQLAKATEEMVKRNQSTMNELVKIQQKYQDELASEDMNEASKRLATLQREESDAVNQINDIRQNRTTLSHYQITPNFATWTKK